MTDTTTAAGVTTTGVDLRTILGRHHHEIGLLLDELLDAFETDNGPWAARCFTVLEDQLNAHLALEEEHVFPLLERTEAAEVIALRAEHAGIRTQLGALCIAHLNDSVLNLAALLPWVAIAVDRLAERVSWPRAIVAALVFAGPFLLGDVMVALWVVAGGGGVLVFRGIRSLKKSHPSGSVPLKFTSP